MEEHLNVAKGIETWVTDHGFSVIAAGKWPGAEEMRTKLIRDYEGHGLGRFDWDETMGLVRKDVKALSDYLGDKQYVHGDRISSVDLVLAACVISTAYLKVARDTRKEVRKYGNLMAFAERMLERLFPEFPKMAPTFDD